MKVAVDKNLDCLGFCQQVEKYIVNFEHHQIVPGKTQNLPVWQEK